MEHLTWEDKPKTALEYAITKRDDILLQKQLKKQAEEAASLKSEQEKDKYYDLIVRVLKEFDGINNLVYDPTNTCSLYLNGERIAWASPMNEDTGWGVSWRVEKFSKDYNHSVDPAKFIERFGEAMAEYV